MVAWWLVRDQFCSVRAARTRQYINEDPAVNEPFFKALVKTKKEKKEEEEEEEASPAGCCHDRTHRQCVCAGVGDDLGRTVMGLVSISALRVSAYQLLTVTLQRHVRLYICKELHLYLCIAEELQLCVCISAKLQLRICISTLDVSVRFQKTSDRATNLRNSKFLSTNF